MEQIINPKIFDFSIGDEIIVDFKSLGKKKGQIQSVHIEENLIVVDFPKESIQFLHINMVQLVIKKH